MSTLYLSTKATSFANNVVNFNDLNDPQTHLQLLKGHYTEVVCEFPTEVTETIDMVDDVACMISRYSFRYVNADKCQYPVKTFFPLMLTKVKQEVLDLCILRGFTVARMVSKYGALL